jgi:acid phosphatase family membrane protein YuiD
MSIVLSALSNRVFIFSFTSVCLAQLLKFIVHLIKAKEIDITVLYRAGGMPSSHSAAVLSLITTLAFYETKGLDSMSFGSSFVFALIVMYDAIGIRRSAGKHAEAINKVVEALKDNEGKKILQPELVELLGHSPIEVLCGALFGFLVTYALVQIC